MTGLLHSAQAVLPPSARRRPGRTSSSRGCRRSRRCSRRRARCTAPRSEWPGRAHLLRAARARGNCGARTGPTPQVMPVRPSSTEPLQLSSMPLQTSAVGAPGTHICGRAVEAGRGRSARRLRRRTRWCRGASSMRPLQSSSRAVAGLEGRADGAFADAEAEGAGVGCVAARGAEAALADLADAARGDFALRAGGRGARHRGSCTSPLDELRARTGPVLRTPLLAGGAVSVAEAGLRRRRRSACRSGRCRRSGGPPSTAVAGRIDSGGHSAGGQREQNEGRESSRGGAHKGHEMQRKSSRGHRVAFQRTTFTLKLGV